MKVIYDLPQGTLLNQGEFLVEVVLGVTREYTQLDERLQGLFDQCEIKILDMTTVGVEVVICQEFKELCTQLSIEQSGMFEIKYLSNREDHSFLSNDYFKRTVTQLKVNLFSALKGNREVLRKLAT
jgi:hypothetical protein